MDDEEELDRLLREFGLELPSGEQPTDETPPRWDEDDLDEWE